MNLFFRLLIVASVSLINECMDACITPTCLQKVDVFHNYTQVEYPTTKHSLPYASEIQENRNVCCLANFVSNLRSTSEVLQRKFDLYVLHNKLIS